jgi:hypothetical protein
VVDLAAVTKCFTLECIPYLRRAKLGESSDCNLTVDKHSVMSDSAATMNLFDEDGNSEARSTGQALDTQYDPLASVWEGEDGELLERMLEFYPREQPKRSSTLQ